MTAKITPEQPTPSTSLIPCVAFSALSVLASIAADLPKAHTALIGVFTCVGVTWLASPSAQKYVIIKSENNVKLTGTPIDLIKNDATQQTTTNPIEEKVTPSSNDLSDNILDSVNPTQSTTIKAPTHDTLATIEPELEEIIDASSIGIELIPTHIAYSITSATSTQYDVLQAVEPPAAETYIQAELAEDNITTEPTQDPLSAAATPDLSPVSETIIPDSSDLGEEAITTPTLADNNEISSAETTTITEDRLVTDTDLTQIGTAISKIGAPPLSAEEIAAFVNENLHTLPTKLIDNLNPRRSANDKTNLDTELASSTSTDDTPQLTAETNQIDSEIPTTDLFNSLGHEDPYPYGAFYIEQRSDSTLDWHLILQDLSFPYISDQELLEKLNADFATESPIVDIPTEATTTPENPTLGDTEEQADSL